MLQTESERLEKEKENIILRESISRLKKQLHEKERELMIRATPVSDSKAVNILKYCRLVDYVIKMVVP